MRQYDINDHSKQDIAPKSYQWHEVFYAVLTQPKLETFQDLLQDPQAKAQRAYLWMFLPSIMQGMAEQALLASLFGVDTVTIVLLGIIFGAIFGLMRFIAVGWIIQRIAIFFGGNQVGYGNFHYARGMYMPIIVIAHALVSLTISPEAGGAVYVLAALLTIEMILTGIALKAVNELPWRQVIMVVTTWYILVAVLITGLGLA